MTTKHSLMGALLLAAALPATALAQAGVSTDRKSSSADTLDAALIATLEKAHAEEIAAGRSALTSTQNDDVKKFARHMVEDHTKANQELNRLADRKGWRPAPAMDEKHRMIADRLAKLNGAEFDREYMKAMVDDHKEAVAAFLEKRKPEFGGN